MTTRPRLLVTGAAGSIGQRVRRRLESDGIEASYLVNSVPIGWEDDPAVDAVDITDGTRVAAVIAARRPTAIIHLAALTGGACAADPERATAVNADATRSLAESAAASGVARVVLASTSAVYGDQYVEPVHEDGVLVLGSIYAQTKRQAEVSLAEVAVAADGLTAIALRIFNVYGPGLASSLANRLVAATPQQPVSLAGLDGFLRDYVHVDDVADALVRAALVPLDAAWSIVNVATGTATSNRALADALAPVHFAVGDPVLSYSCGNAQRARQLLGFSASRALGRETAV